MRYLRVINLSLLLMIPLLCLGASEGLLCSSLANETPKAFNYKVLGKRYQLAPGLISKQHQAGYIGRYYYSLLGGSISVDKIRVKVAGAGNFSLRSEIVPKNPKFKRCCKTYLIHILPKG